MFLVPEFLTSSDHRSSPSPRPGKRAGTFSWLSALWASDCAAVAGFFVGHLALAFDAHAFQGDARHLAAGLELAFHLRGLERVAQLALAAVGVARGS